MCKLFQIYIHFYLAPIYSIISDGLINVNNQLFLDRFKIKFTSNYLNISHDKLKQLSNPENPLNHLIKMNKQIQGKSQLINDLIQLTSDKIQFNMDEILRDTFEQPTVATCTYAILFEDCFETSKIRHLIIDQLVSIWNTWNEEGFRAHQIIAWKKLSKEQRQIVHRIWNPIGEKVKKPYQIDALIDKQRHEMDKIIRIKEQITRCLESYCQYAYDKQLYLDLLSEIEARLKSDIVRTITIPDKIQTLLPFVNRLNSVTKLNAWERFLAENRKCKNLVI